MIALSFRRMIDLRWPSRLLKPLMSFFPGRRLRRFLSPMGDRSFVTPLWQASHDLAMHSREHVGSHCLFGVPDRTGPKRVVDVTKERYSENTLSRLGLSRRAKCLHEKRRKVTPRSHPESCERDEEHVYSILNQSENVSSVSNDASGYLIPPKFAYDKAEIPVFRTGEASHESPVHHRRRRRVSNRRPGHGRAAFARKRACRRHFAGLGRASKARDASIHRGNWHENLQ